MFLKISQNSQEDTCARVSFLTLLKKRLWQRFFPVSFAKFLRAPFLENTSGRLLLIVTWLSPFISKKLAYLKIWVNVSNCIEKFQINFGLFNTFHATGLFLYPPKTSENLRFSDVFRGYRCSQMSFKLSIVKTFTNFTGKHLCSSLALIK